MYLVMESYECYNVAEGTWSCVHDIGDELCMILCQ